MDFLRSLGETVNGAVDFVVEKNRKFSKLTHIKRLIKKESSSMIKAYITLGKHYYSELRDVPNYDMQRICESIDNSKKEIKRLKEKLEEVYNGVDLSEFQDFVGDDATQACKCGCDEDKHANDDDIVDIDEAEEEK